MPILNSFTVTGLVLTFVCLSPMGAFAQTKKPNILVIFGDDIGQANISGKCSEYCERRFPGCH